MVINIYIYIIGITYVGKEIKLKITKYKVDFFFLTINWAFLEK